MFNLYKFAIKSSRVYKTNFIFSIAAVLINDSLFFILYIIFLHHFTKSGLSIEDFLLAWGIFTFWFGILEGILTTLTELGEIIEDGKLDWYLSFPIHPLKLIATSKFDPGAAGDIIFSFIVFGFYFYLTEFSIIAIIKALFVCLIGSIFIIGLAILVGSISFFIQRASLWTNYIWYIYWTIGSYPYKVFFKNLIIIILATIVGLLPSGILGQVIIIDKNFSYKEILFLLVSIGVFILSLYVFNKGLKRYTSGNLVNNNI